ncbi:MAG: DUF1844 domain-containing protein [Calditrichota bacterium]
MDKSELDKSSLQFLRLTLSFQTAAWQHLGKIPNPLSGKLERDLSQAADAIDTLDMLKNRCRGNLLPEEERMIYHILSELKLNYVDEVSRKDESTPKTPENSQAEPSSESPPPG